MRGYISVEIDLTITNFERLENGGGISGQLIIETIV